MDGTKQIKKEFSCVTIYLYYCHFRGNCNAVHSPGGGGGGGGRGSNIPSLFMLPKFEVLIVILSHELYLQFLSYILSSSTHGSGIQEFLGGMSEK